MQSRFTVEAMMAFSFINGLSEDAPWYRLLVEIAVTLPTAGGFGFFARAYMGLDEYNIQFVQPRHVVEVGAIFDISTPDNFRGR